MSFEQDIQSLAGEAAFWMTAFASDDHPIESLGQVSLDVGDCLRAIGIMRLLARADGPGLHRNLLRSAWARARFLERAAAEEAVDDHHFVAGRCDPLLDAIAAHGDGLVARIDAQAPDQYRKGHEYEDEHCYARLLARLSAGDEGSSQDLVDDLIDRMADGLPATRAAREDVCRALVQRDQTAFDEAFAQRLDERQSEIATAKERGQLESPAIVAARRVFIEGLALLRLAEARGLGSAAEYPLCPSLARLREPVDFEEPFAEG